LANTGDGLRAVLPERRVLEIQGKLHRWAGEASSGRSGDRHGLASVTVCA
jgi:hypothetical protein